jgi:hypothetical protein
MICKQCNGVYETKFDSDFVDGICLPCQSQNDFEALERQWAAELDIYHQRTDWKLDYNEFYHYAEAGEVNRVNLVGLPGLQGCYDYAMDNLKFYQYEEWRHANRQLELFNDNLPF